MKRALSVALAVVLIACSSASGFPADSESAKWIDETDGKFKQAATEILTGLKKQPEKMKYAGFDKRTDAQNISELVNDLGGEFMKAMRNTLKPADFDILAGIVGRKVANDKWLTANRDKLDEQRAMTTVLYGARVGAFK